eukprot:1854288-Rhodomonas_salina.1
MGKRTASAGMISCDAPSRLFTSDPLCAAENQTAQSHAAELSHVADLRANKTFRAKSDTVENREEETQEAYSRMELEKRYGTKHARVCKSRHRTI